MNRFTQYSVEQSQQPKGWLLVSRKAGNAYESRKIRPDLLGVPGAQGLPGVPGADGQPGAKGAQGSKGAAGAQGTAGVTGTNGAPGVYPEELLLWDSACFDSFEQYALAAPIAGQAGGLGFFTPWAGAGTTIVSRTNADGTTEKRAALSGGWIARRLPWGSNWNALEICFAARIDRPANTSFGGPPGYYVGICSGEVDTAASLTCVNFYGISGVDANMWQYFVGTQNNYYSHVINRFPTGRVGNVDSNAPSFGSSFPTFSAVEGRKSIWTLRIERTAFVGASNVFYTTFLGNGVGAAEFDWPKQTMMESFARRVNMTNNLPGGLVPETSTALWNEAGGPLDTLNIVWPFASPLEISSVLVRRVY